MKIPLSNITFLLLFLVSCSTDNETNPKKVVYENLYINEIYSSGDDWIELYNDLETTKDISGYFIYDNATAKYKLPSGTIIQPKGFLVLDCNDLGVGLSTNFKLASNGEKVYLENSEETLIDRVDFPELKSGQSYGRYPDGSSNLVISGTTTKGTTNGESGAPAIVSVARTPLVPALNQPVSITATLVSNVDVASVQLFYRFNGGNYLSLTMSLVAGNYVATLPEQSTTGILEYYVEAKGTNNKSSFKPATAPTNVYNYLLNTDPLPELVINEFMAFNSSCCPDKDSGIDEFDDWIEIYNKGNVAVNIGGMYLSDDINNPFGYMIPNTNPTLTTIQPGGYLLVWADNSPNQGVLHTNFALSNLGESIGLYYIDGRTINTYTFGAQTENASWGRTTDGAATWKIFNIPTPSGPN